jgi:hypothetical protein
VIGFLRFVGIANAAVWFGASVFFTVVVGPAFFSEPMLRLLGRPHAGAAAQVVLERYFLVHQLCGAIALLHLVAESLYLGRVIPRWILVVLLSVFALGLVGGYAIRPRLERLHVTMHQPSATEEARERARRTFGVWHGLSQGLNLVVLAGVLVYLLQVTRPPDTSRYRIQ